MVARGEVARTDVAWKEGMAEWKPVSELPEFADALQGAPPTLPPMAAPMAPSGPSPFAVMMSDIGGILKDPEAGLTAAVNRKPPVLAFIAIGIECLIAGLLALQLFSKLGGASAEAFFKPFLFRLLHYGIAFGALMIVLAAILQTPDHWAKAFSILGLACLPLVALGLVAFVFGWIALWFQNLYAAGVPASVVIAYFTFVQASQAGHRFALVTVPIIYFALLLINSGIQSAAAGGGAAAAFGF
jgi:hypothetical protein